MKFYAKISRTAESSISVMIVSAIFFCNTNLITDLDEVHRIFDVDLKAVRAWEKQCAEGEVDFIENKKQVEVAVNKIVKGLE